MRLCPWGQVCPLGQGWDGGGGPQDTRVSPITGEPLRTSRHLGWAQASANPHPGLALAANPVPGLVLLTNHGLSWIWSRPPWVYKAPSRAVLGGLWGVLAPFGSPWGPCCPSRSTPITMPTSFPPMAVGGQGQDPTPLVLGGPPAPSGSPQEGDTAQCHHPCPHKPLWCHWSPGAWWWLRWVTSPHWGRGGHQGCATSLPPQPTCPYDHTGGHPRGEMAKQRGKLRHGSPGVTTRPGDKATPHHIPSTPQSSLAAQTWGKKNPQMGGIHGKGGRGPLGAKVG